MITITIPGKPFAWRRARSNGKVRFKDKATVDQEATLQAIALKHFDKPFDGPVEITVRAWFKVPDSWSRKKREATIWTPHTAKPDLDNLEKMVGDSWNRIAWLDDSQIAKKDSAKLWADRDQMTIIVRPL